MLVFPDLGPLWTVLAIFLCFHCTSANQIVLSTWDMSMRQMGGYGGPMKNSESPSLVTTDMSTQSYTTTNLATGQLQGMGPATGIVTLGYHIQALTAGKSLDVVLVDDANYNLLRAGSSYQYYAAYSSVNTRDVLHPQESFNIGSTNVRLVILASDRGAIDFSGNIQFLSGACLLTCTGDHGFCTTASTCSCNHGWQGTTCAEFACDQVTCSAGTVCTGANTCGSPPPPAPADKNVWPILVGVGAGFVIVLAFLFAFCNRQPQPQPTAPRPTVLLTQQPHQQQTAILPAVPIYHTRTNSLTAPQPVVFIVPQQQT